MKTKKIAAITMARDDEFFLSRWIAYYGKQFGTENLYILLDGIDQKIPENAGKAHITKLPHEPMSRSGGDKYRIKQLSQLAHELLKKYDIVIGCDSDEFLIIDPKIHATLSKYLSNKKIHELKDEITRGTTLIHRLTMHSKSLNARKRNFLFIQKSNSLATFKITHY